MRVVKPLLPKKWRLRFVELHPEYDSLAGGTLLNNVYNLRSTDLGVTELLEVLVAEHQAKRQAELSFQPAMPPVRVA